MPNCINLYFFLSFEELNHLIVAKVSNYRCNLIFALSIKMYLSKTNLQNLTMSDFQGQMSQTFGSQKNLVYALLR